MSANNLRACSISSFPGSVAVFRKVRAASLFSPGWRSGTGCSEAWATCWPDENPDTPAWPENSVTCSVILSVSG